MKTIITAFVVFTITLSYNYSTALPTYSLEAKNFVLVAPNHLEWEIFLTHTNAELFEFSGMQCFFNFNNAIANGGILSFKYASDSSDLIKSMRMIALTTSGSLLRMASNPLPGLGNGIIIGSAFPGFRIARVKLTTTAAEFANVPLNLQWRNAPQANPVTKVNAYVYIQYPYDGYNTEITTPSTHTIDPAYTTRYNIKYAIEGMYDPALDIHSKAENVNAYLRNATPPYDIVSSGVDMMNANTLFGSFHFKNAPNGNYYIVIKHSNSIETWSKAGGENFIAGGEYEYDFTSASSPAYADNMKLKGSRYCFFSGEVNQDLMIDISDMAMVDNDSYHSVTNPMTDLNGDEITDLSDMAVIDNNRLRFAMSPLYGY